MYHIDLVDRLLWIKLQSDNIGAIWVLIWEEEGVSFFYNFFQFNITIAGNLVACNNKVELKIIIA